MDKKIINILNGQYMYDYFKRNNIITEGINISFNEAMCVGEVSKEIFADEFINKRCHTHKVSFDKYREITLKNLEPLIKLDFNTIVLWFDDDMFCQINLLTLLAYLDYANFKGEVYFNLVGKEFELLANYNINVEGYYEIYKRVMINKEEVKGVKIATLKEGIKLYLEFSKNENEITTYIKKHKNDDIDTLLHNLFNRFSNYGLGDTQYINIINQINY